MQHPVYIFIVVLTRFSTMTNPWVCIRRRVQEDEEVFRCRPKLRPLRPCVCRLQGLEELKTVPFAEWQKYPEALV